MTIDFAAKYAAGLTYADFLTQYGSEEHQRRWSAMHATVTLTEAQKTLLASFRREIKALCMAGAWCGDCVEQCPIFDHLEQACPTLTFRYLDRDADEELKNALLLCGGARVPQVVFLNEDGQYVGRYGDRSLAKYRAMAASQFGASCPTGLIPPEASLTSAVTQCWVDEIERIHLMLRLSPRLREKHGD